MRTIFIVMLAAMLLALLVPSAIAAPNLLVNPSFEVDAVGKLPDMVAPTGWMPAPLAEAWAQWQGVYDSTWQNPPCNLAFPAPVHYAVDGTKFLGSWALPDRDYTGTTCVTDGHGSRNAYVYQTINDLLPNTTYYMSAWYATQHPQFWGLFRLQVVPQVYDSVAGTYDPLVTYANVNPIRPCRIGTDGQPHVISYTEWVAAPADDITTGGQSYAGSDEKWSKISLKFTTGSTQNAASAFVQYQMSSANISENQYVQADNVRLATTQPLEVNNIKVYGNSNTSTTIEFDVNDGNRVVTGIPSSKCYVKFGTTTAYGRTAGATQDDAAACKVVNQNDVPGKPGHYKATLTGLTSGATYHYSVCVDSGDYAWYAPYICPLPPESETWTYEAYQSNDASFASLANIVITNVLAAPSLNGTSCIVTWTTNVASDSRVNYGVGNFGSTANSTTMGTSHTITLNGLSGSTVYDFQVVSAATGYNTTTDGPYQFETTAAGTISNGDFEVGSRTGAQPTSWTSVPMSGNAMILEPSGEWSIGAKTGNFYYGKITCGNGNPTSNEGIYQQVVTTPGQVISFYCYSFAAAQGCPPGGPHRFGEYNNQVGVDPTGAKPSQLQSYPSSIVWGGDLGSTDYAAQAPSPCGHHADWRKLGVCAIATGTKATVYLRTRNWWGGEWQFNAFDHAYLEAPVACASVSEVKAQGMQTNVNFNGSNAVVTYICNGNPDADENAGKNYFYIQDLDRGSAIKVTMQAGNLPSGLAVGKKVNIIGTTDWGAFKDWRAVLDNSANQDKNHGQQKRLNKPAGEMVLRAVQVTVLAGTVALPAPLGVTNQTIGGGTSSDKFLTIAGVAGGSGANNVGMRVRTWGKVVEIGTENDGTYFYVIDDGSALPLPPAPTEQMPFTSMIQGIQTVPGLLVRTFAPIAPTLDDGVTEVQVGDYAVLTGISAVRVDLDTDDVNCQGTPPGMTLGLYPEAQKNVRAIKVDPTDGARFFPAF